MTSRPPLPPAIIDRLTKLCGMFGSAFPGERENAARMADALVRSHGLTWHDVIFAPTATVVRKSDPSELPDWERMLAVCLRHVHRLRERERDFLNTLENWYGEPIKKTKGLVNVDL